MTADRIGDSLRKGPGHDWLRAGQPADMSVSYTVIMWMMRMGDSKWENSKLREVIAELVIRAGVPDDVRPGYSPYSSCLFVDQDGLVRTFSSHSWGGQRFFPVVKLGSIERGNQFGTIDPQFKVVGWAAADGFAAITRSSTPRRKARSTR